MHQFFNVFKLILVLSHELRPYVCLLIVFKGLRDLDSMTVELSRRGEYTI